jgi:hypothetical protein
MKTYIKYFCTIARHKWEVLKLCFAVGLYRQGVMHDLSKFSSAEFFRAARHFNGTAAQKKNDRFALAWQHHKHYNPHHWEYWLDVKAGKLTALPMPAKYEAELVIDWIAAGKVYNAKKWDYTEPYKFWKKRKDMILHADTARNLENYFLLIQRHRDNELTALKKYMKSKVKNF